LLGGLDLTERRRAFRHSFLWSKGCRWGRQRAPCGAVGRPRRRPEDQKIRRWTRARPSRTRPCGCWVRSTPGTW